MQVNILIKDENGKLLAETEFTGYSVLSSLQKAQKLADVLFETFDDTGRGWTRVEVIIERDK
jgi:hypothetical protein